MGYQIGPLVKPDLKHSLLLFERLILRVLSPSKYDGDKDTMEPLDLTKQVRDIRVVLNSKSGTKSGVSPGR